MEIDSLGVMPSKIMIFQKRDLAGGLKFILKHFIYWRLMAATGCKRDEEKDLGHCNGEAERHQRWLIFEVKVSMEMVLLTALLKVLKCGFGSWEEMNSFSSFNYQAMMVAVEHVNQYFKEWSIISYGYISVVA